MSGRKLLILYLSCGAGHGRAAAAVREAAERDGFWSRVACVDVSSFYARWFRWAYHDSYMTLVRTAPALANRMWMEEPKPNGRDVWTFPPSIIRRGAGRFFDFLDRFEPDAVISTEIAGCELLTLLPQDKARSWMSLVTIIDFGFIDPVWLNKTIDLYCVPTAWEKERLTAMGVPADAVQVTGIPVSGDFLHSDRAAARRRLHLPFEQPVVLYMAGGTTGGFLFDTVRETAANWDALHVVLAGSNRRDARRLRSLNLENLSVLEWTEQVADWMAAADFLVTKPGGMSLAEAMVSGTPMVLLQPLGCWEAANRRFAVRAGAAVTADSPHQAAAVVSDLLSNKARLVQMSAAEKGLLPQDAADRIVKLVKSVAKKPGHRLPGCHGSEGKTWIGRAV